MNNGQNGSREENGSAGLTSIPKWKRVLDITLILLAMPLLLPVMVAIALMIWIVSEGPILFRQERMGYRGRPFFCFKFRTMLANNDTTSHQKHLAALIASDKPMLKLDAADPRIIPLGVPLRASGLDELPQLINILLGDMSLVGPRPCLAYEAEKYLPWQKERFNTLPGLTGLWQVSGKNRTTFDEMIQLDIDYARGKTLGMDVKIIAKTIPALLVQMQDTRRMKKTLSRPVRQAAVLPGRMVNR